MSSKKSSTDDLRARIFAHQFTRSNSKYNQLKPFGVSKTHLLQDNWKSYKVLLTGDHTSKNIVLQVCFPLDNKENFAIVLDTSANKSCDEKVLLLGKNKKIKNIEKYKIVDDKNTERLLKKKEEEKKFKHEQKIRIKEVKKHERELSIYLINS